MRDTTHIDIVPGGGLRHLLGINSNNTNPEELRTDVVVPVVEMSMGGALKINDNVNHRRKFTSYSSTGGERTFLIPILEYGNATGATSLVYDMGMNFRVICISATVFITDDAYRSTYSGRQFIYELDLNLNTVGGTGNYVHLCNGVISIGSNNPYIPLSNLGLSDIQNASKNLIVPAGAMLTFGMYTNSETTGGSSFLFPAAAGDLTVNFQIAGMQVPIGAPIPSFW